MKTWLVGVLGGLLASHGCAVHHHRASVTGATLQSKLPELHQKGSAEVRVQLYKDNEYVRDDQQLLGADHEIHVNGGTVVLRDLARVCQQTGSDGRSDPCLLLEWRDRRFTVKEWTSYSSPSLETIAWDVALFGPLAGGVACGIFCDGGARERLGKSASITFGTYGVLLVGGLVVAVIACMGHWGEPGCRD